MNTSEYLLQNYGPNINPGSPQIIPGMLRKNMYKLFNELGFTTGAEIGVFRGRNAREMFRQIPNLKLYGIEAFADQPTSTRHKTVPRYERNKKSMESRMKDRNFILIEKFSEEAVQHIPYSSLDFVYIDGDHSYDYAMLDIILWARRVRPGGIVSGHDYILPGDYRHKFDINVRDAVDHYVKIHNIEPLYLTDKSIAVNKSDKCPSWWFVKND